MIIIPRLIPTVLPTPPPKSVEDDGFARKCWVCYKTMAFCKDGTYRCVDDAAQWHINLEMQSGWYD